MFSNKMLIFTVVLTVLVIAAESSSSSGGSLYFTLSGAALTRLYNTAVYKAEKMERPMGGVFGDIPHAGVRVTLADDTVWLIHKGKKYGIDSQTVVVDADFMSSRWTIVETTNCHGSRTVSDLVRAGGSGYNVFSRNCYKAADDMMALCPT